MRAMARRYIEAMAQAPGPLCVRANSFALNAMIGEKLYNEALELIRHTMSLLDETAYLEWARAGVARDSSLRPEGSRLYPFVPGDWRERFHTLEAAYYTQFGRIYEATGDTERAEEAYRKTYSIEPTAWAAMGIARILRGKGKDAEAVDFMVLAALTGKVGSVEMRTMYRETHNGSLDGLEEMLDARFREINHNPIVAERYQAAAARSNRTALIEFFTGTGCVPCIPFDYTIERALESYARKDLVVLVYHMHAPTPDPMGNRSSEARQAYYSVQGAPTPFLDGWIQHSPDGDVRNRAGAIAASQRVYDLFAAGIAARLKIPSPMTLKMEAVREGGLIHGTVTTEAGKPEGSVHLALVEDQVRYTGENGLRFHVMVVRSMASTPFGEGEFAHDFDLAGITAANLRYYGEYAKELTDRVAARGATGFTVRFRENKHEMDPARLSVVAFVQDDQTKEILQSAYVAVK
jgi:tetratricopeptide (TPR) repeat protein